MPILAALVLCFAVLFPRHAVPAQPDAAPPRLRIVGLEAHPELAANVMKLAPPSSLACDAPEVRWRAYLREARAAATSALRALGHFNATIEADLEHTEDCKRPVLRIQPGPPTLIDVLEVKIEGEFARDPMIRRYLDELPLAKSSRLHQGLYEEIRDTLLNRARSAGYLDAHYRRRELWVDPETNTARIGLHLDSGPRYRFGAIRVEQDILDEDFVARLLPVTQGAPYHGEALAEIYRNLSASGYFAEVRVDPLTEQREAQTVPVDVALTPNKRTVYGLRVGFATDTGPRLGADATRRWVNRRGHQWKGNVEFSPRLQRIESNYTIPGRAPLTDSLDFYTRIDREDANDIVSESARLGAQYARLRNGWTQALFGEYRYERTEYGRQPRRGEGFLLAGVKLGHRRFDDPLFPTRGHSLDVTLQGASEALLSATNLVQLVTHGVGAHSLGRFIFTGRMDLGITWMDEFASLPKSLRFFAGGDNSVRGYGFEKIGPRDEHGQVVGGRHLFTVSAEVMHPIHGKDWYGALFVDSGDAFDGRGDLNLKTGVGVGVRWRSPVGLVRLDVAYPLDADSPSPRLHFGIGASF